MCAFYSGHTFKKQIALKTDGTIHASYKHICITIY